MVSYTRKVSSIHPHPQPMVLYKRKVTHTQDLNFNKFFNSDQLAVHTICSFVMGKQNGQ